MPRKFGLIAASIGGQPYAVKADSAVEYDTRDEYVSESVPSTSGGRAGEIVTGMIPFVQLDLVLTGVENELVIRTSDVEAQFIFRDGSTLAGQGGSFVGEGGRDGANGSSTCRFEFDKLELIGA